MACHPHFHEEYQMTGMGSTPLKTLLRAGEIGKEEGLHFVYIGNIAGYARFTMGEYLLSEMPYSPG